MTTRVGAGVSNLLSRMRLASILGFQFKGARDLYEVYGYPTNLSFQDYAVKYLRQDIAQRIVEAPAVATWAGTPKITLRDRSGAKTAQSNAFEEAWIKISEDSALLSALTSADILAGLGHFAILLLGFDDPASSNLENPLSSQGARALLYTQAYSQGSVDILEISQDSSKSDFGKPGKYQVYLSSPTDLAISNTANFVGPSLGQADRNKKSPHLVVHSSRVLHVAERALENCVFGVPRLSAVYNLLEDLLKVAGGSAETFWLTSNRGMQANVDKDMYLSESDAKDLADELEEYQHQLRRFIRTRGVTIKPLGSDPVKPKETFDMLIGLIASATGIPQRILQGAEQGALASESDRANWAAHIDERRRIFAEPQVLRPLLQRLIQAKLLPAPDGPIHISWPSVFTLSPLELAQTQAQFARSVVNVSRQAQFGNPVVTRIEARRNLGLSDEPEEGDEYPTQQVAGSPAQKRSTPGKEEAI